MNRQLGPVEKLQVIRKETGKCLCRGLSDEIIAALFASNAEFALAINEAYQKYFEIIEEFPGLLKRPEAEVIPELQEHFLNFYGADSLSPYLPLVGRGPWIVTCYGAVVYDAGGYGMLGFGHSKRVAREVLSRNMVMANIMTPNLSQLRFTNILREKIGYTRAKDRNPYAKFLTMNSGSEALTVAARISDANAKVMTDPGGKHAGKKPVFIALRGAFHGRTERPAQVSNSSSKYYQALASFRNIDPVLLVEPNDLDSLRAAFAKAAETNRFVEAMFMEPVMGEGNPGLAMTPAFYAEARKLTNENDTLLIVDSVQAGLRVNGHLSIVDYPGFTELEGPDIEAFSKALNAGQFPLSALALNQKAIACYKPGIYGNTMTGNPRGLEIARAVLAQVDEALVKNICDKGEEFVAKLKVLQQEFPTAITHVQGSGLIVSAALAPGKVKVVGKDGIEMDMRIHGMNVIHGGENSLRFTPHFNITSQEIDLIVASLREALLRKGITK